MGENKNVSLNVMAQWDEFYKYMWLMWRVGMLTCTHPDSEQACVASSQPLQGMVSCPHAVQCAEALGWDTELLKTLHHEVGCQPAHIIQMPVED
jgi:hypothetical protein